MTIIFFSVLRHGFISGFEILQGFWFGLEVSSSAGLSVPLPLGLRDPRCLLHSFSFSAEEEEE